MASENTNVSIELNTENTLEEINEFILKETEYVEEKTSEDLLQEILVSWKLQKLIPKFKGRFVLYLFFILFFLFVL